MKIARLHDGSEFNFPPETPDEHIQMFVRKKLGLPDMEQIGEGPQATAMQGVAQAIMELSQQNALASQMQVSSNDQLVQIVQQLMNALVGVLARQEQQYARLERAILTPKKLVYDAKGNLLGQVPGDPGGGAP